MDKAKLTKLVRAYQEHYAQYNDASYNETEVRNDFINPFFEILGWDVLNKKNYPQHLREVKQEASVRVEENGRFTKKKPDYAFYLGSEQCFFLETKKPSVNILENKEPAFQIRRYGWNGNLKASVLSNFTDLVIYDTSVRPHEDDESTVAMVAHYHYTEYVDKIDEIARILSYQAVLSGDFEKTFSNISSAIKKEPFDKYFLSQIQKWRLKISKDIVKGNSCINEDSLNIFVQRLINRIVFLRICEDRNLERYETLKNIDSYFELKKFFIAADKKYNSGLFELIDEESLRISDELLINIFRELYYPNSCYEFSVVDPYIIGQIYELFLEEKISIQCGEVVIEKKPEIIDSQGVVNTPKNITDIVVKETLDSLYNDSKFKEWGDYRVADICCGSGNFLLSTYEYIMNRNIEYYLKYAKDAALQTGTIICKGKDDYKLSYEQKCNILKNNIWGVDIDTLAVEVTKFSLLIKLIEESSLEEMESFTKSRGCKILPNLDMNIRNGNSLVDDNYLLFDEKFFEKPDLITKIKLFDWRREFGDQKFDAIVGNPPYIRVQNMVHYSENEYLYYKSEVSGFETAKAELLDKYYLFLERGLQLLTKRGRLGYIVPHKFMLIKSGAKLRKLLSDKKCVDQIIHFGTEQVFKGKSTYTCLLFLEGSTQKTFEIGFVKNIKQYYANGCVDLQEFPIEYLSTTPWSFLSEDIIKVLSDVKDKCQSLDTMADIFVGLQTSADTIYIIKEEAAKDGLVYFTDCRGDSQCVEETILKPCIYDVQLEKYVDIQDNMKIIFPYYTEGNKQKLYTLDEMAARFPKTLAYLETFKSDLLKRSVNGMNDENWYQFGRSQSLKRFSGGEHLIWSVLSTQGNYVYDNRSVCFTGGGNGPFYGLEKKEETKESILYIQALLNHWLLESVVKSKASTFRGDYYSHGKQYISKLPLYHIDFENPEEEKTHDAIVNSVQNIINLKAEKYKQMTKEQKKTYERLIQSESKHLDDLVSNLYGAENIVMEVLDEE